MNFKKHTATLLAGTMALSLMSVTASATEVTTLNGVTPITAQEEVKVPVGYSETFTLKAGEKKVYKFNALTGKDLAVAFATSYQDEKNHVQNLLKLEVKDSKGTVVKTGEAVKYATINFLGSQLKALKAGEYTIEVTGLEALPTEGVTVGFALNETASTTKAGISSITLSKKGVLPTKVTTKVTAKLDTKDALTKIQVYSPSTKKYKTVKDWSTTTSYNFKQTKAGTYKVKFIVKGDNNIEQSKTKTIKVVTLKTPTKLKTKLSKETVKPKAKFTVSNSASGSAIQYKVAYKLKGVKKYTVAKNYTTAKKVTVTAPSKKGKYTMTVYAKQTNGSKTIKVSKAFYVK